MSIRLIKTTLLVAAIFPVSGILALAQDPVSPPPAAKPEATPAPVAPEPKALVAKGKDTLSVDFPDEEIRNVLRNVADLFDLNLVIPETLQGKTSIKLRDVTWRQIYQVVLQPVGYTFIEDGNIIKVVTQESLNLEPLTTEVFILNYAKATEIKPSLDSLVDNKVGGKIVVDARSNSLVVTERGSVMQKMKPIVLNLDRPTEQVMIESKFIEVSNADVKNLGVNWSSLKGYSAGVLPGRTYGDTSGRETKTVLGEKNIDLPSQLDGYNRANTMASLNGGGPLGPAYAEDATTGRRTYTDLGPSSDMTNALTDNVSRITTAVFSADKFSVILSALKTQNDTKLVSNPTVVTMNNTEAGINMGDEIPIPSFTYNQERGVFEISGFIFKPVGILLKVTPQVNAAGFIKLSVEPEVSAINDTKSQTYGTFGTARIPVISVRKTKTQVTLKDGYTLGIGGMIQKSDLKGQTKVPVLGDIPFLGRLFRSDSKSTESTNLVIFLTAKTIKPDGGDVSEVFDPRVTRQMEIQKTDLPGTRDGSNPFYTPPPPEPKKGWFSKAK